MSYAAIGAYTKDQVLALFPSCWSADLEECVGGDNPSYPHCAEIIAAESESEPGGPYDQAVDAVPWCPLCFEKNAAEAERKLKMCGVPMMAAVAGAGLVVGLLVASVM